jgi:hypothetical protein
VGTASNLQAMGGLNIEGTYSLGIAGRSETIVQYGVTHDTGVSPNRFFPVNNNNQTLLEGASAKSYFWNGTSVVPLPGLYALGLNNEGTILVHSNSGCGLWTNGVVDPLTSINNFLASYVIDPFYLPTSGLIDDNGRILLSFGGSTSGSIFLFTPVPEPSSCVPLVMGPAIAEGVASHHPCRRR